MNIIHYHVTSVLGSRGIHNIWIQHIWEGEMCWSQHKSPHQARAFRWGLDVVMSADISPFRFIQRCNMPFPVESLKITNFFFYWVSMRTDLTICLAVKFSSDNMYCTVHNFIYNIAQIAKLNLTAIVIIRYKLYYINSTEFIKSHCIHFDFGQYCSIHYRYIVG